MGLSHFISGSFLLSPAAFFSHEHIPPRHTLGVLEESLLVQGAGILSPGVGAFHTAFENGTVSSWIFIIASSQVFGDDKSRVFSPVCSCI